MEQKRRIVFLCSTYPPARGGVARHVSDLARNLAKDNFEVYVLTKYCAGFPAEEVVMGAKVQRIPASGSKLFTTVRFVVQAVYYLFSIKPDIIHSHELHFPSLVALFAKILLRIPLVVTLHTQGPSIGDIAVVKRTRFGGLRMLVFSKLVDRFIGISQVLDDEMNEANIPASKRVRIPNSIDILRFSPVEHDRKCQMRQDLLLPNGPIVIMTGRLVWEKRVQNLLEIWPVVRKRFENACLLVIGSGEYEQDFRSRRIPGVYFLGEIEDVVPYIQSSDIMVMVSIYEGFSLSALEGLECGLAVVATPVGAIPEMIVHQQNGWIVPVDDMDTLRDAILTFLENPSLRLKLGENGQSSVVLNYSLGASLEKLTILYNQLLGAKMPDIPI